MRARDRSRGSAYAALAAACLAGVAIRLWNLREQVLGGDELHAVATALGRPLAWILATYSLADYSIPLTAGIRLWLESGAAPSEILLRVPGLVCGSALVALVGVAATRSLGAATGARATWLVALSPALVLYSRIVRSYAPMTLLATGAALAAWRWIETRSPRAALLYAAQGALAIWFHLGAAPFVAAPIAFAIGLRLARRFTEKDRPLPPPSWRQIAVTAGTLAAFCALFLVPARVSLARLVAGVRQTELPSLATWSSVARLQLGASDPVLAWVAFALAGLGLAALSRRRPRLAAYGATLVLAQVAGLLVLRPAYFEYSFILNRYLLPCVAVLAVWVAVGLGALAPARPLLGGVATALFVAVAFARGPLASPSFQRGSFAHTNDSVSFEDGTRLAADPALLPPFYAALARGPRGSVVEIPWHAWWQFSRLFAADQRLHGMRVIVSGEVPGLGDPRLGFRNALPPEPERLARSGADWVVVHLDLEAEQARLRGLPDSDTFGEVPAATRAEAWAALRRHGAEVAARLESAWGPAEVREGDLVAWKLPRP